MRQAMVRVLFAAKMLACLAICAYCLSAGLGVFTKNWYFVALIFLLEIAATALPFAINYAGSRTEFSPDSMVIVAAALLLPTKVASIATPLGYAIGLMIVHGSRGSLFSRLDQTFANSIGTFFAFSAGHLIAPPGSGLNNVLAGLVTAAIYEILGQFAYTVWAALAKPIDATRFFFGGLRTTATVWPWLVCLGVLLGILGADKPLALPLMAAPLGLVFLASRARIVATEDRARLDALLRASTDILAAATVNEVTAAATASAAALFERGGGRIGPEGPQKGELGAKIPRGRFADHHLVVNAQNGSLSAHTRFDDQVLEVLASITASALDRAALHDDVTDQAMRDPLTGLANRRAFEEHVRAALSDRRGDETRGIIFMDLDGFKQINDTHGHEAGDKVLIETASRLHQAVRGDDLIGRLGGDEFTILLRVHDEDDAILVAERVLTAMREPIDLENGTKVSVTPSLAIALTSNGRGDAAVLLSDADAAMYEAKRSGKDRWFMSRRAQLAPIAEHSA